MVVGGDQGGDGRRLDQGGGQPTPTPTPNPTPNHNPKPKPTPNPKPNQVGSPRVSTASISHELEFVTPTLGADRVDLADACTGQLVSLTLTLTLSLTLTLPLTLTLTRCANASSSPTWAAARSSRAPTRPRSAWP